MNPPAPAITINSSLPMAGLLAGCRDPAPQVPDRMVQYAPSDPGVMASIPLIFAGPMDILG
jgi:hypothetical protein